MYFVFMIKLQNQYPQQRLQTGHIYALICL